MYTTSQIAEIHNKIATYDAGKLSIREQNFIESIFQQSIRPGFAGLSKKQNNWLSAIVRKLESKNVWERLEERRRSRIGYRLPAYYAAMWY